MTEVQKQALEAPIDPAQETMRYKDASLPVKERVEDLLGRMTLREKVGQLNQRLYGFAAYERKGDTITLTEETIVKQSILAGLAWYMAYTALTRGRQRLKKTVLHQNMQPKVIICCSAAIWNIPDLAFRFY